jgi:hypothetical protein
VRNAGEGNRIAVGIGGSGLVEEAAAILEADIFRTVRVRGIVVHEDRICLSGMEQGLVWKEGERPWVTQSPAGELLVRRKIKRKILAVLSKLEPLIFAWKEVKSEEGVKSITFAETLTL